MAARLTLMACAGTATARRGGFARPDEPLDEGGRRLAAAIGVGAPALVVCSPAAASVETAAALGQAPRIEARLADMRWGAWTGLSFEAAIARDPGAFAAWTSAPELGAPGGETLSDVRNRAAPWLREQEAFAGPVLAITHPMVIRAILVHALDLPPAAAMRIDIAPLGRVMLTHNKVWRLQALTPP